MVSVIYKEKLVPFLHRSADVCELYEGEVGGYCAGRLHCGQSYSSNCHHHNWPGEVGAR